MYGTMKPETTETRLDMTDDLLRRFSAGELDRHVVMDRLDITYSEMLEMLHKRRLDLPMVPLAKRKAMADTLNRLLDEAAG